MAQNHAANARTNETDIAHWISSKAALAAALLGILLWATNGSAEEPVNAINIDWAYYNPLSLVHVVRTRISFCCAPSQVWI